ncbi:Yip1 family protein [Bacillus sp. B-jedd]|uniref:Yip1 family protein n=1 Tax=Bacillus sp. B-jedd TaxID=1476857 RepID=UPI000515692F|nr:Yip1 family protein [Bacillus sp. B-jedd]CEG25598.1 permease [Bacillus sp. B-jedd]
METQIETDVKKSSPSLLGIFTSPVEQFEKIRTNPKIWIPLLIVSVIYIVGMALMAMTMTVDTLIKQGVPKESAETILMGARIGVVATGLLSPAFGALISSAIQLLVAKIAKAEVSFRQLFSMNTHIGFISAIGLVLNMAVAAAIGLDGDTFITSIAGLLGKQGGVLSAIEVFSIWGMILTAIGLHKTAHFPKVLAWAISIIFFLIGIGFTLIGIMLQGAPSL